MLPNGGYYQQQQLAAGSYNQQNNYNNPGGVNNATAPIMTAGQIPPAAQQLSQQTTGIPQITPQQQQQQQNPLLLPPTLQPRPLPQSQPPYSHPYHPTTTTTMMPPQLQPQQPQPQPQYQQQQSQPYNAIIHHNQPHRPLYPAAATTPITPLQQQPLQQPHPHQQINGQQHQQQPQQIYPNIQNYNNQNQQQPVNNYPQQNLQNNQQYPNQQPQQQNSYSNGQIPQLANQLGGLSVTNSGFNKLWGIDHIDLLKQRHVLPPLGVKPPEIRHQNEYFRGVNCSPDIFRCTLSKIPETKNLLGKSRLPLGVLIHPFKDLTQLPVIQCSTIVRCRSCRTYINPFVYFVDNRRWKCNLCFRVNDVPEEFQYDPITKTYGDPTRRPEIKSGTIEFLAPADYMVRPPQAAIYLFILEVTPTALQTNYLQTICTTLLENLDSLPGDSRTQIGFITFNSSVQFYNLSKDYSQPQQINIPDVDDVFIPCPDGLLVKLDENREVVRSLLMSLPGMFMNHQQSLGGKVEGNCLGAALGVGQKLVSQVGGRITLFQHTLPTLGPGSLISTTTTSTTTPKPSSQLKTSDLNPQTDYYKKIALDCSTQYIAVDLFFLASSHADLASVGCAAKYSGGCIYKVNNDASPGGREYLENCFTRYLTRKIGFEAVMRIRCSRGLSIHTFHGNLFVRSTDLLSLPNCNPDSGFGMQVSIDEDLRDFQNVAFQAALLYTSSKGERRIRVHTLCLPVASNVNDIIQSADQQAIIGLLAKMGVDRSLSSSIADSREAFVNAAVDIIGAYMTTQNAVGGSGGLSLLAPHCLVMLPGYVNGLLRSAGFRTDPRPLDERVHFFNQMKSLPLFALIQSIYPDLYRIDGVASAPLLHPSAPPSSKTNSNQNSQSNSVENSEGEEEESEEGKNNKIPQLNLLNLGSDRIDANGVYLLDTPELILIYACRSASSVFLGDVFGVSGGFQSLNEMNELPDLPNENSGRIRNFVRFLQCQKPFPVPTRIIREDSRERLQFITSLIEDRGADASIPSYYEFLNSIKNQIKS